MAYNNRMSKTLQISLPNVIGKYNSGNSTESYQIIACVLYNSTSIYLLGIFTMNFKSITLKNTMLKQFIYTLQISKNIALIQILAYNLINF